MRLPSPQSWSPEAGSGAARAAGRRRERGTRRALAGERMRLEVGESVADETVRRTLKQANSRPMEDVSIPTRPESRVQRTTG
jgi:hypothetical protein